VGGGVALCWFYETLKNGLGARSSPPFLLPSLSSRFPCPHSAVHAFGLFCGVAITRQSPLPFGPLMDARCVGTGVPLGPMGCDRIHTRSASSAPKGHASSFVNPRKGARRKGFSPRATVELASEARFSLLWLALEFDPHASRCLILNRSIISLTHWRALGIAFSFVSLRGRVILCYALLNELLPEASFR